MKLGRFDFDINSHMAVVEAAAAEVVDFPPPPKCSWVKHPVVQLPAFSGQPNMRTNLGRCALVGSGTGLNGRKLGEEIDRHDTVIRVNRIPTGELVSDSGSRTDIYFVGAVADKRDRFQREGCWAMYLGKDVDRDVCPWSGNHTSACPFGAIVFNRGKLPIGSRWIEKYPRWKSFFAPVPHRFSFPVGFQGQQPYQIVKMLEPEFNLKEAIAGHRATSGLQAIFTFISMCEIFHLYGFNQTGTLDGHLLSKYHSVELEHQLVDRILTGEIFHPSTDFLPRSLVRYLQCLSARAYH